MTSRLLVKADVVGLSRYSVWHDVQEQWDPDNIEVPVLQCHARSAIEAAEKLADTGDSSCGAFIVRHEGTGEFRQIELERSWNVKANFHTTLASLCEP